MASRLDEKSKGPLALSLALLMNKQATINIIIPMRAICVPPYAFGLKLVLLYHEINKRGMM